MIRALILRLDALWMSFGGVIVDHHGVVDRFPGAAMLTGLVGNALGWEHAEADRLQALQRRIVFAARWDVPPHEVVDYQTVDLGQEKMRYPGWTTRGAPEHREGGPDAKFGIHIRYRHYWEDGLLTLALALKGEEIPTLDEVREALRSPARPLFLGRKCCLPARPLLDPKMPVVEAEDVRAALARVPCWRRDGKEDTSSKPMEATWPAELGVGDTRRTRTERVHDLRDWRNQLMTDARWRVRGLLVAEGGQG